MVSVGPLPLPRRKKNVFKAVLLRCIILPSVLPFLYLKPKFVVVFLCTRKKIPKRPKIKQNINRNNTAERNVMKGRKKIIKKKQNRGDAYSQTMLFKVFFPEKKTLKPDINDQGIIL